MTHMKVGYIQSCPSFGDKTASFDAVATMVRGAQADLLVLPELFATGYTFTSNDEALALAENTSGETFDFLARLSGMTGAAIAGGFIERDGSRVYNSAMLVTGDRLAGVYRKLHLFFKEKKWFSPGDLPLSTWEIPTITGETVRVGLMICFDWIFPEVARTLALGGAEILAHPVNLVLPFCQAAMITRCLENRVFAVTANRIGTEKRGDSDFTFTGGSQIVSPGGVVLERGSKDSTCLGMASLDLAEARDKHVTPMNDVLADRRPSFYLFCREDPVLQGGDTEKQQKEMKAGG